MKKLLEQKGLKENISIQFKHLLELEDINEATSFITEYFGVGRSDCISYKNIIVSCRNSDFVKSRMIDTLIKLSFIDRLMKGENPEEIVKDLTKGYDEFHEKKIKLLKEFLLYKEETFRNLTDENIWLFVPNINGYLEDVYHPREDKVIFTYGTRRSEITINFDEQYLARTITNIQVLELLLKHLKA